MKIYTKFSIKVDISSLLLGNNDLAKHFLKFWMSRFLLPIFSFLTDLVPTRNSELLQAREDSNQENNL